ncbi:MAG: MFS transporter [Thermoprotei archaeon]|nr:MAG: MFS transporter [Thermoprotei archaeon]
MYMDRENGTRLGFRNVVALGFVSLFTDASSEMVFGVLPLFIVKELRGGAMVLGIIDGMAELANYFLRVFSGFISDVIGKRKLLIFTGYFISNMAKPFFSLTRNWLDVLAVRLIDRLGKGVRTAPRDALISESIHSGKMGMAFGIHRTLDQIGAILGPALAFLLLPFVGYRGVFAVSLIPGLLALIVLLIMVKEPRGKAISAISVFKQIRYAVTGDYLRAIIPIAIFSLGVYSFSFILVKGSNLGVSDAFIPLLYALINVTHTLVGVPAGILSDRIGKGKVLLMGYFAFMLTSLFSTMAYGNPLYAAVIALIYGVYVGVAETIQRALVAEYAPPSIRGAAYSFYYLVIGLCLLVSNIVFGILWDVYGPGIAFTYSSVTALIAMVATTMLLGKRKAA